MLARRLQDALFGDVVKIPGGTSCRKWLRHPDGLKFEWPGNDGIILSLVREIMELQRRLKHIEITKLDTDVLLEILEDRDKKPERTKRNKK